MGGVRNNQNFRLNFDGWEVCRKILGIKFNLFLINGSSLQNARIALAPMTGAVENMGFPDEESYYPQMMRAAFNAGLGLSIGDGTPDIKLKSGIAAIEELQKEDKNVKASVFIKPYSDEKILERAEWAGKIAERIGIDIDAYKIKTMKGKSSLEKKTAEQLLKIKKEVKAPFVIKGIFRKKDIDLVKEVRPDVAYISNHGGRIETETGSTAEFLLKYAKELKKYCGQLWVDGGIRSPLDVATASFLGADQILIGRPFVTALCKGGAEAVKNKAIQLRSL